MYAWDTFVLLRHLLEQGLSKTVIAARAGVSRRILYQWIAAGLLDRDLTDLTAPPPRHYASRRTKLDPFRAINRRAPRRLPRAVRRAALRGVPRRWLRGTMPSPRAIGRTHRDARSVMEVRIPNQR